MSKFTPGPWTVSGRRIEHGSDRGLIAIISERPFARSGLFSVGQMQDNARLIAAAPEMAELLDECAALIDGELVGAEWKSACHEFTTKARALLARIEGEK